MVLATARPRHLPLPRHSEVEVDRTGQETLLARADEGHAPDIATVPPGGAQLGSVSYDTLESACRRLTARELAVALRQRYLPISFGPEPQAYAAADAAALAAAQSRGLPVVATAAPGDLVAALQAVYGEDICGRAAGHLVQAAPEFSARWRLSFGQAVGLSLAAAAFAAGWYAMPLAAAIAASLVFGLVFLAVCGIRLLGLLRVEPPPPPPPLGDGELPVYTLLVPLFRETSVLGQLVAALCRLDYPADKLDIKLILEASDGESQAAVGQMALPGQFEVLVVPDAPPQTKPKALNYGLQFARGDLVAIYDAEDVPAPRQLRLAAETFAAAPSGLVCLQARLGFYNAGENWLTRQVAIEYAILYELMLPVLARLGLPLPLGGTSNHFRAAALRRIGAWDPHNVTEDADLGMRLARFGWRAGVLASTTGEEAACRWDVWLRQRARWLKGWMQVGLVHLRAPARTWRELGPAGSLVALVLMVGMTLSALTHPLFLALFVWSVAAGGLLAAEPDWVAATIGGLSLAVLAAGYGINILAGWVAIARRYHDPVRRRIAWSLLGIPFYWILIWLGACLALWQLVRRPYHWDKTEHGLSRWRHGGDFA
jgi:glycosyltransferase XagB